MESDMTSILVKTKYFRSTIFGRDFSPEIFVVRFGLPLPFLAVTCRATERALLRRFGPIDAVWLVHGQKITETRARDATHARGTPGVPAVHRGTTTDIPDRPRTTPLHPRRQNSDFAYFDTFGAFWRDRVLIPPFNVLLVPAPKMT